MKFQKLNQEKVRYHGDMKQRPHNPTFASSNVWGSLKMQNITRSKSFSQLALRKPDHIAEKITQSKRFSFANQNESQLPGLNNELRSQSRRSHSNLFTYGLNSLGPLKKPINDRDIYEKQSKKYNIVTIQPKQYIDTINLFPKYRLENSDKNINKRFSLQKSLLESRALFKQTEKMVNKKLAVVSNNPQQQQQLTL